MAVVNPATGMAAMEWIVAWGAVAVVSAAVGAIFANQKNRDPSSWAAWCFVFPPLVLWIMLASKNPGPRPRPKPVDDLDDRLI